MRHELPPLGFYPDALEPAISRRTIELHHGKHHRGYVDKLNELLKGSPHEDQPLEQILATAEGAIYDNAAQHFNHSLYWNVLAPGGAREPGGELERAIEAPFGDLSGLRDRFLSLARGIFGSGWAWLVRRRDGTPGLLGTANAIVPLEEGRPVLACDVWEHAYYLDYENERSRYLEAYWRCINWDVVSRLWSRQGALVPSQDSARPSRMGT